MTHEPDFNELTAFIERRLSDSDRLRVITHLSTCRACREVVAALASPPAGAQETGLPHWRRMTGMLSLAALLAVVVIVSVMSTRQDPMETAPPVTSPPAPATPAAPPSEPPAAEPPAATAPPPAVAPAEDLQRVRGATRAVGGKTFRFVAGEWIDSAYDPQQLLPVVEATTPAEREALLRDVPALKAFTSLQGRVVVVVEGTVYRF